MENTRGLIDLSPEMQAKVNEATSRAKELIMNDAEVWDFVVKNEISDETVNRNISEFTNYIQTRHNSLATGYSPVLRFHEGLVITEYRKTEEGKRREIEYKTTAVLDRNSIVPDKSLLNANFNNYIHKPQTTEETVLKQACDIARKYLAGEEFNTIFKGSVGAGKSHLAMAIAQWVNDQARQKRVNKTVLFFDVNELFRKLRGSIEDKHSYWTEENVLTMIRNADLVILDDLGSESSFSGKEQATDYVQRFLFAVINANHSIITTTNLENPNIVYNPKIVSRLGRSSTGSIVDFNGIEDKR